jgi:tetraacyldisaccharide 4'-kinase
LRVHAFSGIARPEKFFTTLREIGADIVATTSFADHHMFSTAELDAILDAARRTGARPVTTAKDHVRLPPDRRDAFGVLEVHAVFDDSAAPDQLLDLVQQRHAR